MPSAQAGQVSFTDSVFDDADWSAFVVLDTTATPPATFAAGQALAGGNPGPFRQVAHTYDRGTILVGHFHDGFVYDPTSVGEIASVDYSYDLIALDSSAVFFPYAIQNGSLYEVTAGNQPLDGSWEHFTQPGLTSLDFRLVDGNGPEHPDFSAGGGAVQFGFGTGATSVSTVGRFWTNQSGIDNLHIRITPVPEPGSLLILTSLSFLLVKRPRPSALRHP